MTPCDYCQHRVDCDFIAGFCNATPTQIVRYRKDLLKSNFDADKLRKQKRESEARRRTLRREQIPALRLMFSKLLTEYGTFGKHAELMNLVRTARR